MVPGGPARLQGEETAAALTRDTDMAVAHGVFRSPGFVVGDDVFRGDGRAEDTIARSATGSRA